MFLSPDEAVKIESIHVYEMPAYLNLVRRVLLVLSGLILPAAALWLRQYKYFTALLLGISLLFIYTNYSLSPKLENTSDSQVVRSNRIIDIA